VPQLPKLLEEIYRVQRELTNLDDRERLLLKMCANLLESHYEVKPQNGLTSEEYFQVPGRFEMVDGMLRDY
jgi:hypothetical protein